jgi:hypothetical protein
VARNEGGREAEGHRDVASDALRVLVTRIADIFGILDVSFFISGAVCFGAILFGAYVFRLWTAWADLAFLYSSGLHVGGVVVTCYVLGMVCFSGWRQRRRSDVYDHLGELLDRFGIRHRYARFIGTGSTGELEAQRGLAAGQARVSAARKRLREVEARARDHAALVHDGVSAGSSDSAGSAPKAPPAQEDPEEALADASVALARTALATAKAAVETAREHVAKAKEAREALETALGAAKRASAGATSLVAEERGAPAKRGPDYGILYTRLWAELRQSKELAPSFNLVLRYWVLAAMCDGLVVALGLWASLWLVFAATTLYRRAGAGGDASGLPLGPTVIAMVLVEVSLWAAAYFCKEEARRYTRYQMEEIVATLAYVHDEEEA